MPVADTLGGLEALLAKATLPENVPLLVGEKTTSYPTLLPAAIVSGNETPETENCELLLPADETVTGPPVAVITEACVVEVPTSTLPTFSEPGVIVSVPCV